jgi:hypothetical protein
VQEWIVVAFHQSAELLPSDRLSVSGRATLQKSLLV